MGGATQSVPGIIFPKLCLGLGMKESIEQAYFTMEGREEF